jgi:hypothetical protein
LDEQDEYERDRDPTPDYRDPSSIEPWELWAALDRLVLVNGDSNLRQQSMNLGLVDQAATDLETKLLRKQFNEEPYGEDAAFVNALSQMWIFAAYELLRTWRQRCKSIVRLAENGGLHMKVDSLRAERGFTHYGKEMLARQIEGVIKEPEIVEKIRDDLKRTHYLFVQIEALRVSIAKHEVRGRANSVAIMPTYGRINRYCGSLDYEVTNDRVVLMTVNRRNIADSIRAIPEMPVPKEEDINSFDKYMRGPTAEELEGLFADPIDISKPSGDST